MIASTAALCLSLAIHEGIKHTVYTDSLGYKTVGVGHKILPTDPEWDYHEGQWVTDARIIELFSADCEKAVGGAKAVVPYFHELPDDVQNVLVEMTFQLGSTGLSQFKRFLAAIERRDYLTAVDEMWDSRWARQTPTRVKALANRIIKVYEDDIPF